MIPISVIILMKNAEKTISNLLEVLKDFDEIIIINNNSTDKSFEIASKFLNVKIYNEDFIGFGPLKNKLCDYATNNWVLSIDSDEIPSKELLESIKNTPLKENQVYGVIRLNHFNNKPLYYGGQYPDKVLRLFNKNHIRFNNNLVHESLDIKNNIKKIYLKGDLLHYSFRNVKDLIAKMDHYSDLYAESKKFSKNTSLISAINHGFFSFIKHYILKKGFLDGYQGFMLSSYNGIGSYTKYLKLYEANKNIKISIVLNHNLNLSDLEIKQCLSDIKKQGLNPFEIIIISNTFNKITQSNIHCYSHIDITNLYHNLKGDYIIFANTIFNKPNIINKIKSKIKPNSYIVFSKSDSKIKEFAVLKTYLPDNPNSYRLTDQDLSLLKQINI